MLRKLLSIVLTIGLLFNQGGVIYAAGELNLSSYLSQLHTSLVKPDIFRPVHLRYFSYDSLNNSYKILLDKGDYTRSPSHNVTRSPGHQVTMSPGHQVTTSPGHQDTRSPENQNTKSPGHKVTPDASVGAGTSPEKEDIVLKETAQELMDYFLIGVTLPNDSFWVNLRPDAPDTIIDPELERTDIGKVFLEADLQLKKDTASFTSPQTPEGKAYWDKLYKKAGELFGSENITIPTLTRPWIVPNEIIVRETDDSAYVYKATLKVLLEEDYLKSSQPSAVGSQQYNFKDSRLKELNEYSTQLIRETIIPKLTKEVNSSQRYAKLRQVYYSLILSRWFKARFNSKESQGHQVTKSQGENYINLIDRHNLTNLTSKESWDKTTYFNQYKDSFNKGEYNIKEPTFTAYGQSIRSYTSGGIQVDNINFDVADGPVAWFKGVQSSAITVELVNAKEKVLYDKSFKKVELLEPIAAFAASPLTFSGVKNILKNTLEEVHKDNSKNALYFSHDLDLYNRFIKIEFKNEEQLEKWLTRIEESLNDSMFRLSYVEDLYKKTLEWKKKIISSQLAAIKECKDNLFSLKNPTQAKSKERKDGELTLPRTIEVATSQWSRYTTFIINKFNQYADYWNEKDIATYYRANKDYVSVGHKLLGIINKGGSIIGYNSAYNEIKTILELLEISDLYITKHTIADKLMEEPYSYMPVLKENRDEFENLSGYKEIGDFLYDLISLLSSYKKHINGEEGYVQRLPPGGKDVKDFNKILKDEIIELEKLCLNTYAKAASRFIYANLKPEPAGIFSDIKNIEDFFEKDRTGMALYSAEKYLSEILDAGSREMLSNINKRIKLIESMVASAASPLTLREIKNKALEALRDADPRFGYYRRNYYSLNPAQRIDAADDNFWEDVVRRLEAEISYLNAVIEKERKGDNAVVYGEAIRIKDIFKGLVKQLKDEAFLASNQEEEIRNGGVKESALPLDLSAFNSFIEQLNINEVYSEKMFIELVNKLSQLDTKALLYYEVGGMCNFLSAMQAKDSDFKWLLSVMGKSIYGVYIKRVILRYEKIAPGEILTLIESELNLNTRRLARVQDSNEVNVKRCQDINSRLLEAVAKAKNKISEERKPFTASPVVNSYKDDNPKESITKAYKEASYWYILNDYEYRIIAESLGYNPMLAAYKLGWIIKNKLRNNQIEEDIIRKASVGTYGFMYDAKEIDNWLHWLTVNDVSIIRETVNGVLDSISSMLPQGSSLKDSINDQRRDIEDIPNNYIYIIKVLNAAIDTLNKELPTAGINRGFSNDDLKAAESELRKLLSIALTDAIVIKIYDIPGFSAQVLVESDLYVNDFKSALNKIPRGLYMSEYEYSLLNRSLGNLPIQRKDFFSSNTAVVPAGKLLMLELQKSMAELDSELQSAKEKFGPIQSEWAESAAELIFSPVYRKYHKKLLGALTDMQDIIYKTKKNYNIWIDAGDNFDHSIDALSTSSQDLRDVLFQVRGYLNYNFSKRLSKSKGNLLEVLRNNYELVSGNLFMSGKEILNRYFPKRYKSLYDAAYRVFSALEKYEDRHKVLKNGWEKYKTDPAGAASPVTAEALKNAGTMPVEDFISYIQDGANKDFADNKLLKDLLARCQTYMSQFLGAYAKAYKQTSGKEISAQKIANIKSQLSMYFGMSNKLNTAIAAGYFSRVMEDELREPLIAKDFEELQKEIRSIAARLDKMEHEVKVDVASNKPYVTGRLYAYDNAKEKVEKLRYVSGDRLSDLELEAVIIDMTGLQYIKYSQAYHNDIITKLKSKEASFLSRIRFCITDKNEVKGYALLFRGGAFSISAVSGQQEGIEIGIATAAIQEVMDNLSEGFSIELQRFVTADYQLLMVLDRLRGGNPLTRDLYGNVWLSNHDADAIVNQYNKNMAEAVSSGSASPLGKELIVNNGALGSDVLRYVSYDELGENNQKVIKELLAKTSFESKVNSVGENDEDIDSLVKVYSVPVIDESMLKGIHFAIKAQGDRIESIEGMIGDVDGTDKIVSYGKTLNIATAIINALEYAKIEGSSSAVVEKETMPNDFDKGGIDMTDRVMHINLERMGSFADLEMVLPELSNVEIIDLDDEYKQIQAMAASDIRPSDTRILEFITACYYKEEFTQRLSEITACLKEAHSLDEREGRESSQTLRLATLLPDALYANSLN